jgi:hypothetical protein
MARVDRTQITKVTGRIGSMNVDLTIVRNPETEDLQSVETRKPSVDQNPSKGDDHEKE